MCLQKTIQDRCSCSHPLFETAKQMKFCDLGQVMLLYYLSFSSDPALLYRTLMTTAA